VPPEVREAFKRASETTHRGILGVDEEYRVSQDFIGEEHSTVVAHGYNSSYWGSSGEGSLLV